MVTELLSSKNVWKDQRGITRKLEKGEAIVFVRDTSFRLNITHFYKLHEDI